VRDTWKPSRSLLRARARLREPAGTCPAVAGDARWQAITGDAWWWAICGGRRRAIAGRRVVAAIGGCGRRAVDRRRGWQAMGRLLTTGGCGGRCVARPPRSRTRGDRGSSFPGSLSFIHKSPEGSVSSSRRAVSGEDEAGELRTGPMERAVRAGHGPSAGHRPGGVLPWLVRGIGRLSRTRGSRASGRGLGRDLRCATSSSSHDRARPLRARASRRNAGAARMERGLLRPSGTGIAATVIRTLMPCSSFQASWTHPTGF
jgi:hypothetical protein